MEPTGRMFLCDRCRVQVIICSRSDRGQRYCTGNCADDARRASLRPAAATKAAGEAASRMPKEAAVTGGASRM